MSIGGIRIKENIGPAAPAAHGVIVFRGLALCLSQPSPPPSFRACKGAGRTKNANAARALDPVGRRTRSQSSSDISPTVLAPNLRFGVLFLQPAPTKKLCAATNWPDSRTRGCPSRRIHRRNDSLLPNEEYWHGKHKNPLVLVN